MFPRLGQTQVEARVETFVRPSVYKFQMIGTLSYSLLWLLRLVKLVVNNDYNDNHNEYPEEY